MPMTDCDLPDCVKFDIKLFADDTKLYACGRETGTRDLHQVQIDLEAFDSCDLASALQLERVQDSSLGSREPPARVYSEQNRRVL